jgi:hypothetical protein
MKKIIATAIMLSLIVLPLKNNEVKADTLDDNTVLGVYTEEVPQHIITYAQSDFINQLNLEVDGFQAFYLGSPFRFYHYINNVLTKSEGYCFFVIDYTGDVYGTYEVFFNEEDEEYYSSFNRGLLNNTLSIIQSETETSPYFMVSDETANIWAVNEEKIIIIETGDTEKQNSVDTEKMKKDFDKEKSQIKSYLKSRQPNMILIKNIKEK